MKIVSLSTNLAAVAALLTFAITVLGQQSASNEKMFPKWQAIPLPQSQVAIEREGHEIARYHFGTDLRRPFLFPLVGPSGRNLTRMGHPHDPNGHSHHNSVWIAHHDVNGIDFWGDSGKGRIVHRRTSGYSDGLSEASVIMINEWLTDTKEVLLEEERTMRFIALPKSEWLLSVQLKLTPKRGPVTFGKTPFGFMGVRMAKTVGVHDGGGVILNSEGGRNEKEVFWKKARWVDYSGQIADSVIEGITLFDHPGNPGFPCYFHVRDDGWMGASASQEAPLQIAQGESLVLRYGLYVHAGPAMKEQIESQFLRFSNESFR